MTAAAPPRAGAAIWKQMQPMWAGIFDSRWFEDSHDKGNSYHGQELVWKKERYATTVGVEMWISQSRRFNAKRRLFPSCFLDEGQELGNLKTMWSRSTDRKNMSGWDLFLPKGSSIGIFLDKMSLRDFSPVQLLELAKESCKTRKSLVECRKRFNSTQS